MSERESSHRLVRTGTTLPTFLPARVERQTSAPGPRGWALPRPGGLTGLLAISFAGIGLTSARALCTFYVRFSIQELPAATGHGPACEARGEMRPTEG